MATPRDGVLARSEVNTTTIQSNAGAVRREVARSFMRGINPTPQGSGAPPTTAEASFSTWSRRYVLRLVASDLLVGLVAVTVAGFLTESLPSNGISALGMIAVVMLCWPAAVLVAHGYERKLVGIGSGELHAVFRAGLNALVVTAVVTAVFHPAFEPLQLALATVVLAIVLSLVVRYVTRKVLHRSQASGRLVRRTLVVGGVDSVEALANTLTREPHLGMASVGMCVPTEEIEEAERRGLHVLGSTEHVPGVVREFGCDAVAVSGAEQQRGTFLRGLAWSLEGVDVELFVHPGLVEVAGPRMHMRPHVGLPLLQVEQPHFTGWRRIVKRVTDVVLTGAGLLLISPVLGLIALLVKLGDRGPVLFRQTRVGIDGKVFTMLKFRSMRVDAEERLAALQVLNEGAGPLFKMKDDPRVTKVGKFLRRYSLDELPQLFNVMSGSMSLVGPRPPLPTEADQYGDDVRRRLLVTPGLTGLWQVSGRSALSWEESVRLDLRYVENWSFSLDLLILWKTAFAVVAKRGAY